MEDCGQSTGYILYEAKLPEIKEILTIESCKDRALVYVDEKKIGIYERDRATEDIWVNTLENPDAKMWIGLILVCVVLPAVLSFVFNEIFRKLGWIKTGDMKIDA